MFRLIKKLIKLGLIIVIFGACMIGLLGYYKYKEAISEIPIREKVVSVREDENFVALGNYSRFHRCYCCHRRSSFL